MQTAATTPTGDPAAGDKEHTTTATLAAIAALLLAAAATALTAAWLRRPRRKQGHAPCPPARVTPVDRDRTPERHQPPPSPPPSPEYQDASEDSTTGGNGPDGERVPAAETQQLEDSDYDDDEEEGDPDAEEESVWTAPLAYRMARDGTLIGRESYRLPTQHGDTPLVFGREPGD